MIQLLTYLCIVVVILHKLYRVESVITPYPVHLSRPLVFFLRCTVSRKFTCKHFRYSSHVSVNISAYTYPYKPQLVRLHG